MKTAIIFLILLSTATCSVFSEYINHEINAKVEIKSQSINVTDKITIPEKVIAGNDSLVFYLNKNLTFSIDNKNITAEVDLSYKADSNELGKKLIMRFPAGSQKLDFTLKCSGKVNGGIKSGAVEYARGFSETNGIISDEGVYLSGSTYWIPYFEDKLFTYDLNVRIDKGWDVVSQGKRIKKGDGNIRYESPEPMEGAYLIAAKWTEYSKKAGNTNIMIFLRTPDEKLAQRYLQVSGKFLKMYEEMIGPYPYTKFAVVENFWETGYGMPSFTLLGQKVIRFPFILYSSYPHELLHNWWGNSVYVDYKKGNWCEGITAYMADHLFKEQQGLGASYRRTTLQKYTDFVNEKNDFPVTEFTSRQNPAQEAIGYGKVLMINHMLRKKFGDNMFIQAYRDFYKENKFKVANFDDIQKSFEKVTGKDLYEFFDQWVKRSGAPEIILDKVKLSTNNHKVYQLDFELRQVDKKNKYKVDIPVAIFLEGQSKPQIKVYTHEGHDNKYTLVFLARPYKIIVDPFFDVFRKLDRREVPTTLSQIFGSEQSVLILPSSSPNLEEYKTMSETWKKSQEVQGKKLEVINDNETDKIPSGKAVWILGFENKFYKNMNILEKYKPELADDDYTKLNDVSDSGSVVFAVSNPSDKNYTLGFVGSNIKEAVQALIRKLPHYGKYGFLGFKGAGAQNVVKGEFPVLNSPMIHKFETVNKAAEIGKLVPAKALWE